MTTQVQNTTQTQVSAQRIILHLEGLTVFLSSIALYWHLGANGWLLLLLFFSPDLAIAVYALNKSLGAKAYNLVHTYALSIAFGIIAFLLGWQLGLTLGLIWTAHIGFDRTMGYGLKYESDFKDTHLQRI